MAQRQAQTDVDVSAPKLSASGVVSDEIATMHELSTGVSTRRLTLLTISIAVGLFLSMVDTSIVATALYTIGAEFNQPEAVTWIALAYTLAYVGCAVLFARLSDVVGRRNAHTAAFVIFIAFSLGCGFATSLDMLIAFRTIQGIGGSGLYSLTMVIFPEVSPPKLRQAIGGVIGLVVAISGVLGPVLGGVITGRSTWRWIFWMNVPIGIPALVLFLLSWPSASQLKPAERHSLRQVDFFGSFLLVSASVLVVFCFQEAGLDRSGDIWRTALFLAPLVSGCACWIALLTWQMVGERLTSVPPLLPTRLFRKRVYLAATLCTITMGFVYFVAIFSIPTHFQIVYQKSALVAGVSLVPMLGSAALGSLVGGIVYSKPGTMFPGLVFASALMALGTGLLSTVSSIQLQRSVYGFQVLVGLGFGLTVSNVTMLAVSQSQPRDHAVAQGIIAQARVLGGSIGIAASTAILGAVQRRQLANVHDPLSQRPSDLSDRDMLAVRHAYADAFVLIMRVTAIIACVSLVLSLGTFSAPAKQAGPDDDRPITLEEIETPSDPK